MSHAVVAWLRGRGKRREYWIASIAVPVAAMVFKGVAQSDLASDGLDWASVAVWCVFAARRLRDAGLPAWLAPFPVAIYLAWQGLNLLIIRSAGNVMDLVGTLTTLSIFSVSLIIVLAVALGVWKPRPASAPSPDEQAEVFG